MRITLLLLIPFLLSGCFRSGSTISYYALEGTRCENPQSSAIRVYEFETSPLIQSRLLFAHAPFEYGEFQTLRWKDSPGNAIAQALREAFTCSEQISNMKQHVLRVMGRIIRLEFSSNSEAVFEVELRVLTQAGLKSQTFIYKVTPKSEPSPREIVISINEMIKRFQSDAIGFVLAHS